MYKSILVPLEPAHLEKAEASLDLAEFLKSEDGRIILLSVVEEIPAFVASQIPQELLVDAGSHATAGLNELVEKRGMEAEVVVMRGHAASTIQSVQEDYSCDLIIISSHKPQNVDFLLGSTASKVVRRAKCSVHVIR